MHTMFRWASIAMFAALGVFLILFGTLYATVHDFLPFHAAAMPSAALDASRPLYLALMKLIGGASGALGVLGLFVILGPVRRGETLAAAMVALTFSAAFLTAAFVAEALARVTNAPTSWHIMGILLAITISALGAHLAAKRLPEAV